MAKTKEDREAEEADAEYDQLTLRKRVEAKKKKLREELNSTSLKDTSGRDRISFALKVLNQL